MGLRLHLAAALATFLSGIAMPAFASVLIEIDKSTQHMAVSVDGAPLYDWPVSTGAQGYETPAGSFRPFRMEAQHFSKEWDDAPMPHSIFFTQLGHAIHGSSHRIGRPASHGCVRLSVAHAATLYALVKQEGMPNTQVVISGTEPLPVDPQVARQGADPDLPNGVSPRHRLPRPQWQGDADVYTGYGSDPLDDNPYLPRRAYRSYPDGTSRGYEVYPEESYPRW